MLTYLAIADRLRPKWLVWENVPGVLSSNGGRDFGTFLGALGQLGYGWAYRVLDAQYVRVGGWPRAVPQRRRRVFVVGCLGDWAAPGEVLALAEGLQRHLEARRAKGKGVAADAEVGSGSGCCGTVSSKWAKGTGGPAGDECYNLIAQPVPYDLFQITAPVNRQNRAPGDPCHTLAKDNAAHAAVAFQQNQLGEVRCNTVAGTVNTNSNPSGRNTPMVAFHPTQDPISSTDGSTHCMGTGSSRGDATIAVAQSMTVRRLTPRECERLQGFPDDWTMIPYRGKPAEQCPDGPRYKALGNSMACNCMAWIGERIAAYEAQNGST